MSDEIRDSCYKLIDDNSKSQLYEYIKYHYTGDKKFYLIQGIAGDVIERIHKIFIEDKFSFPEFTKIKDNDDGTVVYKGNRLLNRSF